jgi:hypothetical protein
VLVELKHLLHTGLVHTLADVFEEIPCLPEVPERQDVQVALVLEEQIRVVRHNVPTIVGYASFRGSGAAARSPQGNPASAVTHYSFFAKTVRKAFLTHSIHEASAVAHVNHGVLDERVQHWVAYRAGHLTGDERIHVVWRLHLCETQ